MSVWSYKAYLPALGFFVYTILKSVPFALARVYMLVCLRACASSIHKQICTDAHPFAFLCTILLACTGDMMTSCTGACAHSDTYALMLEFLCICAPHAWKNYVDIFCGVNLWILQSDDRRATEGCRCWRGYQYVSRLDWHHGYCRQLVGTSLCGKKRAFAHHLEHEDTGTAKLVGMRF